MYRFLTNFRDRTEMSLVLFAIASARLRFCLCSLRLVFGSVWVRIGSAPVLFGFALARLRTCLGSLRLASDFFRVRFGSASVLFAFALARLRFCLDSPRFGVLFGFASARLRLCLGSLRLGFCSVRSSPSPLSWTGSEPEQNQNRLGFGFKENLCFN